MTDDDELFEELENLAGLYQDARAQNDALRTALIALLNALDDIMPAVRDVVAHALDEALESNINPLSDSVPEEARQADLDALSELRARIDLSDKRMSRG